MAKLDYSFLEEEAESPGALDYSFLETEAPADAPEQPGEFEKVGERLAVRNVKSGAGLLEAAANQKPAETTTEFVSQIGEKLDLSDEPSLIDALALPSATARQVFDYVGSMATKGWVDIADLVKPGDTRKEMRETAKLLRQEADSILGSPEMQYQGSEGAPEWLQAGQRFGLDVIENAANMAPAMLIGWGTRNPGLSLATIGGQVAGNTYADYMNRTGDHNKAMAAAKFHTMAEVIPETIPVMAILRKTKAGEGMKRMLEATFGEGAQEMLTSVLTQTYDAQELESMSLKDAINNIDWGDVAYEGAIGFFVGGTLATPGAIADTLAKKPTDQSGGPPELFTPTHNAGGGQPVQVATKNGKVIPDTYVTETGEVIRDSNAVPIVENAEDVSLDINAQAEAIKTQVFQDRGIVAEFMQPAPEPELVEMPTGLPEPSPTPEAPSSEGKMTVAEVMRRADEGDFTSMQGRLGEVISEKDQNARIAEQEEVATETPLDVPEDAALAATPVVEMAPDAIKAEIDTFEGDIATMTAPERERLQELKTALPTQGEEVAAAKGRIAKRVEARKQKRLEPKRKTEVPIEEPEVAKRTIEPQGRDVKINVQSTGQVLTGKMAVVEADQLIASNDLAGNTNPQYPAELQPRDRSKGSSMLQINKMAADLKPELLGDNNKANGGSPIIGPDGVVESGNGRTLAILKAYQENQAEAYREHLKQNAASYGLTEAQIDAMQNPVLVRVRDESMDINERAEFARQANQSGTAPMTPTENAQADAARIPDAEMQLYNPSELGNVLAASNQPFLEAFGKRLGDLEVGGLSTPDGRWTKQMADRVQAAVFYKAYENEALLALMAEEADPDIKNILSALNKAAPAFARARSGVEDLGDLDIINDIVGAIDLIRKAKAERTSVKQIMDQGGLFGDVDPVIGAIAEFIESGARSPKRLGVGFTEMANFLESELSNLDQGALFDMTPATKSDIVAAANRRLTEVYGQEKGITDLFARRVESEDLARGTERVSEPGPGGSEQTPVQGTETGTPAEAPDLGRRADPYADFEGKDISYQVEAEDTGRVYTVTIDAAVAMRDLETRLDSLRTLRDCI